MNKKVLLVKCLDPVRRDIYAFKQIPLGIAYLAAIIKDHCNLEVFDMRVDDGLLEKIHQDKPDIIGLSIFSVDFIFAEELIKTIKKLSPHSLIVAGGAHATVEPAETLQTGADFVIRGEGERAFLGIVKNHNSLELKRGEIPGISYFNSRQVGGICHNPIVCEEEIDNLPFPAIDVFDLNKYNQFPLLTARGCPYSCKFCASKTIWGQRARFHSTDRVFAEITRAVKQYGYRHIVFIDDTFTLKHSRLSELCDLIINSGFNITWAVNSRIDTITSEIAQKMSQAGCRVVSFGIETGSELIQAEVDKKLSRERMRIAIKECRDAGIRVKSGWVVGLPGNYDEQMKSLDLMLELKPDEISIHHFIPIPVKYPFFRHTISQQQPD